MDIEHLCLECMSGELVKGVCSACGWDSSKPDDPSIALKRGTVLNGKYIVGKVLGQGGFGITYLAWDKDFRMKVAIKEYLQTELATRSAGSNTVSVFSGDKAEQFVYGKEKFIEEARAIARFDSHECIVSARDYFEENNTAYFVMKYIEGLTFKEYLDKNGGRLGWDIALKIMMPVLDGLREVHRAGMLHRDISPDNIYITNGGHVKILDFGSARYAIGNKSRSLSVVLKPGYAPEEQYKSRGNQGAWTDVYAVSACLYRAVTGERPPEALDRLDEDLLQRPSSMGISIPSHVEDALMKGLAVRATDRYQTVEELQRALQVEKPVPSEDDKKEYDKKETGGSDSGQKKKNTGNKAAIIFSASLALIILVVIGILFLERKFDIDDLGMKFVWIEPGTFMMGSPGNEPERGNDETLHKVTLTKGFYMQTTVVTQGQWKKVMGNNLWNVLMGKDNPSYFKNCGDNCPVESVSWNDVKAFIKKLNSMDRSKIYRLPTEAEWEYACRAGTTTPFNTGPCLSTDQANYHGNYPLEGCPEGEYRGKPVPVGSFPPNAWGLYDMHGNVLEWCEDWYDDYPSGAVTDPVGSSSGSSRVSRGGSWGDFAGLCRSASRNGLDPGLRYYGLGFRLVYTPAG